MGISFQPKTLFFLLLLFLGACAPTDSSNKPDSSAQPSPEPASDLPTEASFREAVETFNQAFLEGNAEKIGAMVTDNYQHTNGSSLAMGKERWTKFLKMREQEIADGLVKDLSYVMDQERVEMYGNTGILTARVTMVSEVEGEEVSNAFRVTNVWVYEKGTWKRAGFHDEKIK